MSKHPVIPPSLEPRRSLDVLRMGSKDDEAFVLAAIECGYSNAQVSRYMFRSPGYARNCYLRAMARIGHAWGLNDAPPPRRPNAGRYKICAPKYRT